MTDLDKTSGSTGLLNTQRIINQLFQKKSAITVQMIVDAVHRCYSDNNPKKNLTARIRRYLKILVKTEWLIETPALGNNRIVVLVYKQKANHDTNADQTVGTSTARTTKTNRAQNTGSTFF